MRSLIDYYRGLSPTGKKVSLVAAVLGVLFDLVVLRHIIRSDSMGSIKKLGWMVATLVNTPSGGLAYLKYARR